MKYLLFSFVVFLVSCKTVFLDSETDKTAILQVLHAQENAWNMADIDRFMQGYHRSDSLKFIGRNGVTYGWDNVLSNYKRHYSSPEKMGNLNFRVIHLEPLGSRTYRMIGSYQLTFSTNQDPQKGYFTLIWQRIHGQWLITSDHTS